ncbi:MAG: YceD family protein [Candidatus Planktophila sp.]
MSRASQVFQFNTHELPRRAGELKEYQLDLQILEPVGIALIAVPAGDLIEVDMRLESVTEGILLSADVYAIAKGECIRCLDPIEVVIERKIQELYLYEPTAEKSGKRGRKARPEEEIDLDGDDELWLEGNNLDLEAPLRDAIVLDLPVNPLCSSDCLGLCPDCGEKWEKLPDEHAHQGVDARWAGLAGLDFKNLDE